MNKPINKSCPKCKYTLFRDLTFTGTGSGYFKCPNCLKNCVETYIKLDLEQKPKATLTVIEKISIVTIAVAIALIGTYVLNQHGNYYKLQISREPDN